MHDNLIQSDGNYMEMKKINYMLEIDIEIPHKKFGYPEGCFLRVSVSKKTPRHGLSQQGVWVPFWTPIPFKRTPQDTQKILCAISKNLKLKIIIEFLISL